jgi:hypothetical protein
MWSPTPIRRNVPELRLGFDDLRFAAVNLLLTQQTAIEKSQEVLGDSGMKGSGAPLFTPLVRGLLHLLLVPGLRLGVERLTIHRISASLYSCPSTKMTSQTGAPSLTA